jgi:Arc/MetJ-type ribon-helix-helix transcriptional regulator
MRGKQSLLLTRKKEQPEEARLRHTRTQLGQLKKIIKNSATPSSQLLKDVASSRGRQTQMQIPLKTKKRAKQGGTIS